MSDDNDNSGLIANSYTNFFKIRKRIRRIQDIPLPFKRGLGADQFVTFLAVLAVLAILFFVILNPIIMFTGVQLEWTLFLVYFLVPPVLAAQKIGNPMPNGKSIPGAFTSSMRSTHSPRCSSKPPRSPPKAITESTEKAARRSTSATTTTPSALRWRNSHSTATRTCSTSNGG